MKHRRALCMVLGLTLFGALFAGREPGHVQDGQKPFAGKTLIFFVPRPSS